MLPSGRWPAALDRGAGVAQGAARGRPDRGRTGRRHGGQAVGAVPGRRHAGPDRCRRRPAGRLVRLERCAWHRPRRLRRPASQRVPAGTNHHRTQHGRGPRQEEYDVNCHLLAPAGRPPLVLRRRCPKAGYRRATRRREDQQDDRIQMRWCRPSSSHVPVMPNPSVSPTGRIL